MNKYILDYKQLPSSLAHAFDEPDDKISVLNKLVNQCMSEHALPVKQKKFTRPPAPWPKDPEISKDKKDFDNLNSRNPKEVWETIHCILDPSKTCII